MSRISQLIDKVGETSTIRGWMFNRRGSKQIYFMQLRDGSGFIQGVVVKDEVDPEVWETVGRLKAESSVEVIGLIKAEPRAPTGCEILVKGVRPIHEVTGEYPIQKKEHGPDFLLDNRHLWLRSKKQWAILRVRHEVIRACREYLDGLDFIQVDAPIFTPNACEGTTTLFEVPYFELKSYLTQSGQLYNEAAAMAHGRVYCFGPAFRAEKSKTRRHLTEFWMIEPEAAFMDWEENMDVQEGMTRHVLTRVLERRRPELEILERDVTRLEKANAPFPRVSYTEAIERLKLSGRDIAWGDDFGAEDETLLGNQFDTPVFVTRYPTALKAFYLEPDPEDPKVALCNDCLAPEGYGEIIGAGQRMQSEEKLEQAIDAHQLPREAFRWYLDLRTYGTVPHSGFGMGLERVVTWICGIHHLRETIPFPRMIYRNHP